MKYAYSIAPATALVALLATGCGSDQAAVAQAPAPAPAPEACPTIAVSCPASVADGEPITFAAEVRGIDENFAPTFNWTVSAGTISSGQGTSVILVDTYHAGGQTATATIEVGGLDAACNNTASCSLTITN